jgi:D-alanine-D-alanine ligase
VVEIKIAADGRWWKEGKSPNRRSLPSSVLQALDPLPGVVFIALHGGNGEDGTVQGMLELLGLPYTGSGVLASSLGMDKWLSRALFRQEGLVVPRTLLYRRGEEPDLLLGKAIPGLGVPLVVKPNNCGSSIGVRICRDRASVVEGLHEAAVFSGGTLLEEYLSGVELTVPILGNSEARALPVIEIVPPGEFFDYRCKYDGSTQEICPARIADRVAAEAQEIALRAYRLLGCSGFGRVDMIYARERLFLLEVNTIPGMTRESLVPKAARAVGLQFPDLVKEIVRLALERSTTCPAS